MSSSTRIKSNMDLKKTAKNNNGRYSRWLIAWLYPVKTGMKYALLLLLAPCFMASSRCAANPNTTSQSSSAPLAKNMSSKNKLNAKAMREQKKVAKKKANSYLKQAMEVIQACMEYRRQIMPVSNNYNCLKGVIQHLSKIVTSGLKSLKNLACKKILSGHMDQCAKKYGELSGLLSKGVNDVKEMLKKAEQHIEEAIDLGSKKKGELLKNQNAKLKGQIQVIESSLCYISGYSEPINVYTVPVNNISVNTGYPPYSSSYPPYSPSYGGNHHDLSLSQSSTNGLYPSTNGLYQSAYVCPGNNNDVFYENKQSHPSLPYSNAPPPYRQTYSQNNNEDQRTSYTPNADNSHDAPLD